jgi:DNA-directed RNA polymerase subunit RPC12/RpoP
MDIDKEFEEMNELAKYISTKTGMQCAGCGKYNLGKPKKNITVIYEGKEHKLFFCDECLKKIDKLIKLKFGTLLQKS